MDTPVTIDRKELIHRTSQIVKALMMGYELKCSNGMILRIDEEGNPWIKGKIMENKEYLDDTYIKALFDVDIKFLQNEAKCMSEEDFMSLAAFITMNVNIQV